MVELLKEFFSRIFYILNRRIKDDFMIFFSHLIAPFRKIRALIASLILKVLQKIRIFFQILTRKFVLKRKKALLTCLAVVAASYFWFACSTMTYAGYNPDYVAKYSTPTVPLAPSLCVRSAIVDVAIDLTDFNVNQNTWVSSMLLYKIGFFGMSWDRTSFFDNKASFQRGIQSAVQRMSSELVDSLGRVRGTSQIDPDMAKARGQLQYDTGTWYFSFSPVGFRQTTQSSYRTGIKYLRKFNDRLGTCDAVFDARSDNLATFVGSITSHIGSTSAALNDRSKTSNSGWFDTLSDNYFWEAMGQLYAYYGFLSAAHIDFKDVIAIKYLDTVWNKTEMQLRSTLDLDPFIISNGSEDGWFMPTHLTTLDSKILHARSNLVEIRDILRQ
jgi:hypothetical protein